MSTSNLGIGDRVYLTSDKYSPSRENPLKSSPYECKGTIYRMTLYKSKTPTHCLVAWDNGCVNSYVIARDLTPINSFCTNYKSIW